MTGTCKRCMRPRQQTVTLYLGLIQNTPLMDLIPLSALSLNGGKLEICTDCHAEWVAAMRTWFELATTLRAVPEKPE